MKITPLLLLSLALFTSGCFLISSPYAEQLNPAVKRYRTFREGISRGEVEGQLGRPLREEQDGPAVWETRFDEVNYARLEVWFDPAGRAKKTATTHAHGTIAPNSRTSAVTVRGN
ncbi:MAG: hypothetical protein NTV51_19640 [Verrucomicrobia bacterium]|nr:hypothetical protein [Verrucomicrobiota bacterium]